MSRTGRSDSRTEDCVLTLEPTTPGSVWADAAEAVAVGSGGAAPVGSGGLSPVGAAAPGATGATCDAGAAAAAGAAATAATPPAAGTAWSDPGRGGLVVPSERWNRGFSCLDRICPSAFAFAAFQV